MRPLATKPSIAVIILLCYLITLPVLAQPINTNSQQTDPHYTKAGFFDIHVCNWPGRPSFLMGLFSSTRFNEIKSIELYTPTQLSLGRLDLDRYRWLKRKNKADKKVFIKHFSKPTAAKDGWYTAIIVLNNGEQFTAKDYVLIHNMPLTNGFSPEPDSENIPLPNKLSWTATPGARFFQVFIKDLWQDGKLIYKSKLLTTNELIIPPGLLQSGGYYSWQLHARDVNEHILLGDFNHGSLSPEISFSTQ